MSENSKHRRQGPAATATRGPGIPTLIRENHGLLSRVFQEHLSDPSAQVTDWFVLRTLHAQDGLTQREVAERIGILEAHTGVIVRRLETLGYVERRRDPGDMRRQCVYLTPAGVRVHEALVLVATEVDGIALAGLSKEQVDMLHTLLLRIRNNLSDALRNS